ncbi:lipopolysaccharide core biosynthesis protein [Azoarcus olearius]|uniref:lipopolysaccharide kinase InaA family protein n=1 Tax=Azoarcus sp. (strain BH72) TaxID=418699 RepID=UPI000806345F|nr:lipopolysaccharide kinase InaA family protein [Azoarcus olearius]ANQ86729.1 lipopolysaccharide core biosynthesis protein [Azoarcus olearius]
MTGWTLDRTGLAPAAAEAFASLDAVFALAGEAVARDPLSQVLRVTVGARRYYVKRYHGAGKNPLRRWLGRPRVQAEWENLQHFAAWGIPTARLVGWGLERHSGAFARGALITAELERTTDLNHMARFGDPRLADRRWVAAVSRQLADITRRMHARRFTHNDLKWRNLLVDDSAEPRLYLIDCPAGEFWWGPFLQYRIVKDLACLDKVAKYHLSRPQRLRFYLDYVGRPRLTAADKRRLRRVLDFFEGRE